MIAPNPYYNQVGSILGIQSVDSQNDLDKILALASAAGIQQIDSANDVRSIQSYYDRQNAPPAPSPTAPQFTYNPPSSVVGGQQVIGTDVTALQQALQQQQNQLAQQNLYFQQQTEAFNRQLQTQAEQAQAQQAALQGQLTAATNQANATVPGFAPVAGNTAGAVSSGGLPALPGGRAPDSLMFGGGFMPTAGQAGGLNPFGPGLSGLAGLGSLMIA